MNNQLARYQWKERGCSLRGLVSSCWIGNWSHHFIRLFSTLFLSLILQYFLYNSFFSLYLSFFLNDRVHSSVFLNIFQFYLSKFPVFSVPNVPFSFPITASKAILVFSVAILVFSVAFIFLVYSRFKVQEKLLCFSPNHRNFLWDHMYISLWWKICRQDVMWGTFCLPQCWNVIFWLLQRLLKDGARGTTLDSTWCKRARFRSLRLLLFILRSGLTFQTYLVAVWDDGLITLVYT